MKASNTHTQQQRFGTPVPQMSLTAVVDALVADGLLSPDKQQLAQTIAGSREARERHPFLVVVERGWRDAREDDAALSLDTLTRWLAERSGLAWRRIDPLKVDVQRVTGVMSYAYAARFNILALEVYEDRVVIATADPTVDEWRDELARVLRREIEVVIANPRDIERYLVEFYSLARSVRQATGRDGDSGTPPVQNLEQLVELGRQGGLDANDHHVVNIVDWLLQYALEQRASDIHMEPRRELSPVRFRIDGVLHTVYEIPTPVMAGVTARLKILGRMDVAERRRPQDGRLKTRKPNGKEVELRLSSMPTAFGEKLVMRIFNPDVLVQDLASLGFSAQQSEHWHAMIGQQNGIVLVTGPTGSGKTTTLYSSLKYLAKPEVNVSTIEDPIELMDPAFNQMQVHRTIGLDFAAGVRTLLRQDPDIIMVGEIRDQETAEMAAQAAQTGHLVLATLHTNDAPSAVTRLLDLGLPHYLLSATLCGVAAQRLVRTLCPHCKQPTEVNAAEWEGLVRPWKAQPPRRIMGPVGCLECRGTGYMGRTGVYEVLPISKALRRLLRPDAALAEIREQGIREGLRPLRLSGAQKIADGLTTVEEVERVTPPPDEG